MMKFLNLLILLVISLGLTAALAGCQFQNKGGDEADEHREGARVESSEHRESSEGVSEHQESREEVGEHREAGEEHAEEGEESGERFALNEIHDKYGKGIRLILAYDKESSAFRGTAENIIEETIPQVRVEVHLSNGAELGPTPGKDLKPGEKIDVVLSAEGQTFTWWTAHAESGQDEEPEEGDEGSGERREGGKKIKK